jgi:hypothetical protein
VDSDLLKAVVAGISSAITTLAVVPLLVKGKIRHERELVAAQGEAARLDKIRLEQIAERDEQIERMLAAAQRYETESREQIRVSIESNRELLNAVKVVENMSKLAANERRSSGDD